MRGKQGNVRAENFRDAILMRAAGVKMRFAMLGADEEAARTTGGV